MVLCSHNKKKQYKKNKCMASTDPWMYHFGGTLSITFFVILKIYEFLPRLETSPLPMKGLTTKFDLYSPLIAIGYEW